RPAGPGRLLGGRLDDPRPRAPHRPAVPGRLAVQGKTARDAGGGGRGTVRATARGRDGEMKMPLEVVKLKVCMAGEGAVGKTSLLRRYVLDEYDDRYVATLGTKITKKSLTVPRPGGGGQVSVDVILWDIMGTPMLRELLKEAYYHGANGILAVADLTRHHTLAALA